MDFQTLHARKTFGIKQLAHFPKTINNLIVAWIKQHAFCGIVFYPAPRSLEDENC